MEAGLINSRGESFSSAFKGLLQEVKTWQGGITTVTLANSMAGRKGAEHLERSTMWLFPEIFKIRECFTFRKLLLYPINLK